MTTATIDGLVLEYTLRSPISTLSVTASGYVLDGISSTSAGRYTIANNGTIADDDTTSGTYCGVYLKGGGVVTNSGEIRSFSTASGAGVVLDDGGSVSNAATGRIIGAGGVKVAAQAGTVASDGTIIGTGLYGVELTSGGKVTNGAPGSSRALMEGGQGIDLTEGGTVLNYGTVIGLGTVGIGAYLGGAGRLTNGTTTDTTATMSGYADAVGAAGYAEAIYNFGTLFATGTAGVAILLTKDGEVTNGAANGSAATIDGPVAGIEIGGPSGGVYNFGTVTGGEVGGEVGVLLKGGGTVTNGSNADTKATIAGAFGIAIEGSSATIANFGTAGGVASSLGVYLLAGGDVTNGSSADTAALIEGSDGVGIGNSPGTVTNFGTILGLYRGGSRSSYGVWMDAGGAVTNGSSADKTALITGEFGVLFTYTATGTVTNFGSIVGLSAGVVLQNGGRITNGSASDTSAYIGGAAFAAAIEGAAGTLSNFGTVRAGEQPGSSGALLTAAESLINGGTTDAVALIESYNGVTADGGDKITNYGTIAGVPYGAAQGVALASGASLTNEAGALIEGAIGAELAASVTAINFGTIVGEGGLAVTLVALSSRLDLEANSTIVGTVGAGSGVVDAVSGISSLGALQSAGLVEGAGTILLDQGVSDFDAGVNLSVAEIAVSGPAIITIYANLTDSKVWAQSSGDLIVTADDVMTFKGATDSFSGTISGPGTVAFDSGTDSLANVTLAAALTKVEGAATLTLSGAIDASGPVDLDGGVLSIAATGATLSGGGLITLGATGTNIIKGATSAAILTNADTVKAAGQIGDGAMSLINSGTIESDFATALTINTGSKTVTNSGLIEAIGTGGLVIDSVVANSGTLESNGATLTVDGAVTGGGTVKVDGGEAIFDSSISEAVRFYTTGRLVLGDSQAFKGVITGFSTTGETSLDLKDIDFSGATISYSGTSTSGVLTVTDGTHTAKISLTGDYLDSTWMLSNDGSGGTVVVDPAAPPAMSASAPPHALIAAQASFGATPAGLGSAAPFHATAATMLMGLPLSSHG